MFEFTLCIYKLQQKGVYRQGMKNLLVTLVIVIGVIAFLFMLVKFGVNTVNIKTAAPNVTDRTIDLTDINRDPLVYQDLTLTLTGHIGDWSTKKAFIMGPISTQFLSGDSTLVIAKNNFNLPDNTPVSDLALGEVANVKVSGQIKIPTRDQLVQYLGIDPYSQVIGRWQNHPIILADKIEKI